MFVIDSVISTRRGSISMRAAVIVCEQPCVKGQLDYAFREDYESTSGGPALNPTWGEGTFDTSLGPYRFLKFSEDSGHPYFF